MVYGFKWYRKSNFRINSGSKQHHHIPCPMERNHYMEPFWRFDKSDNGYKANRNCHGHASYANQAWVQFCRVGYCYRDADYAYHQCPNCAYDLLCTVDADSAHGKIQPQLYRWPCRYHPPGGAWWHCHQYAHRSNKDWVYIRGLV